MRKRGSGDNDRVNEWQATTTRFHCLTKVLLIVWSQAEPDGKPGDNHESICYNPKPR